MDKFIKDKVRITCENLFELSEKVVYEIPEFKYVECGYKKSGEVPIVDKNWEIFKRSDFVLGQDKHFWFYAEFKTPSIKDKERLVLEFHTGQVGNRDMLNPQGILYLNGKIVQGIDINHREASLDPDTEYKVLLYLYTGTIECRIDVFANIKVIDIPVRNLYYDIKVPYDAALCFNEDEYAHIKTLKHLEQTCNFIDFRNTESDEFYKGISNAQNYIKKEYYQKVCGNSDAVVSYIGHTHIDVAWLWTLEQTREKTQRSFATVLSLMERYPEYVFMSSQPQLYEFLREEEPKLYERVKEMVKKGRWEVEGAMWLEADCNLSSGESLVRQIMHGKKFMKDEFEVDSRILWLPDVFGYSAALPQILKKSGVEKFVTSKISWCETNKIPYDSFVWEGIDGTEIFTYFLTAQTHESYCKNEIFATYNGRISPQMNLGTWERYQQKEYNNETLVTFGYGDGGGGPTEEMLENYRRLEYGLPGMPKAKMSFAGDFLNRVEKNFFDNCMLIGRTPKWVGELYLEFHRGTYTSMAKNKKNNRECEFLCQGAETLSVIDNILTGTKYPKSDLNRIWRVILLNQFHDIIPGSSIYEVYEESDRQYLKIKDELTKFNDNKLEKIADNVSEKGLLVYNPNSFIASGYVKKQGELIYAENIPPMGWKVIKEDIGNAKSKVNILDKIIDSPHYILTFDDDMNIISIFDKDNNREIVSNGKKANQLKIFEDYPRQYDNWEITNYYKQKMWLVNDLESVKPICGNGFGGFEIVRKYCSSKINQRVIVYEKSRRIDFENTIDWHEHHVLLKTAFPTTIHSNKATYEIQFGNVERPTHENTSWDMAKFEVCAHKWADLSEDGYGVSILNDCKYGHSILGNEMSLTLIKCGTDPNPQADQGIHQFTYSLYPHCGDFKQGKTINEAYLLNRPLKVLDAKGEGNLSSKFSLVNCDSENIVIEAVKEAENGKGIIIRLYDAWNKKTNPEIKLGFNAKKIYMCDLLEKINENKIVGFGNSAKISVGNFEIVTLFVEIS